MYILGAGAGLSSRRLYGTPEGWWRGVQRVRVAFANCPPQSYQNLTAVVDMLKRMI